MTSVANLGQSDTASQVCDPMCDFRAHELSKSTRIWQDYYSDDWLLCKTLLGEILRCTMLSLYQSAHEPDWDSFFSTTRSYRDLIEEIQEETTPDTRAVLRPLRMRAVLVPKELEIEYSLVGVVSPRVRDRHPSKVVGRMKARLEPTSITIDHDEH